MTSNNNIPQGYKQTDLGIIPEDWEVVTIQHIADITTGNKNTQDAEESGKYPFYVRSQNVERINSYCFDCEGVVTAGDGVGTGKIFHFVRGKFALHQRAYLIYNFRGLNPLYFYSYFSQNFYERINQMTAKSSVDSVRKEMIENMQILKPPLAEQKAIATALSDVDALIVALDKKIEKKKLIKQGAMQQLLTGKKRLPGFTDDWIEECIEKTCYILDNKRIPLNDEQRKDGIYPYCGANGIISYIDKYIFDEDLILMAEDGGNFEQFETRPIAYLMSGKYWVNNHAHVLKSNESNCQKYIYYQLVNKDITDYIVGGTRTKLTKAQLNSIKIKIPLDINEQQAIATILSDMDKEISDLEAKRDKYRLIKQGMMQKLLTGQIRLKIK